MDWQEPIVLLFCKHCSRQARTLQLILNVMVLPVWHASRYSELFANLFAFPCNTYQHLNFLRNIPTLKLNFKSPVSSLIVQ